MEPFVRDLLALHLVPGLGPRLTQALLDRFGTAGSVLQLDVSQLQEIPHIGPHLAEKMRRAMDRINVDAELERMEQNSVRLLVLGTPEYPASLANIPGPPLLLYMRGELAEADTRAIAVVGSRHCSSYGRRIAEQICRDLVRAGFTVVSGLARGIDGVAHRSALKAGGRTLAVLAGGLARIYPPEHKELSEEVCRAGALFSEAPMEMAPMASMFPARNRIISGLTQAVVLIEANEHSGALITARHAAEQGREVFAVPGPVDSPFSAGTLKILRQGAKLVRHAEDILQDLGLETANPQAPRNKARANQAPNGLDELSLKIWNFLQERPRYVDEISRNLQLPMAELSRTLMMMELNKQVRRLPGNQYEVHS